MSGIRSYIASMSNTWLAQTRPGERIKRISRGFQSASSQLLETFLPPEGPLYYNYEFDTDTYERRSRGAPDSNRASQVFAAKPLRRQMTGADDEWGFKAKSGIGFRKLLVALAILASFISFLVDFGVDIIHHLKIRAHTFANPLLSPFAVEAGMDVLCVMSARLVVEFAMPAIGSGLPEVKCILSGFPMSHMLGWKVLCAKAVGLTLAISGSLPVGKEGPFVHIAACVSALLLAAPPFKQHQEIPHEEILLAAVAVGVGATFTAPVGGVLFALELMMPRLYDTSTYVACFFASTMGTLTFICLNMLSTGGGLKPLFNSDIATEPPRGTIAELVFIVVCAMVGVIAGSLGSLFVKFHRASSQWVNVLRGVRPPSRDKEAGLTNPWSAASRNLLSVTRLTKEKSSRQQFLIRDLGVMAVVGFFGAALKTLSGIPYLNLNAGPLLTELFKTEPSEDVFSVPNMLLLLLVKWFHTALALSLPIPAGVVAPSLVLGALVGRTFAVCIPEFVQQQICPNGDFNGYMARFAIVGAAAFCGSVCRVISVVVTVFELIAVPSMVLPLSISTIAANYMGNLIGVSIFDSILMIKKIPAMPTLAANRKALLPVYQVLNPKLEELAIPRHCSPSELAAILDRLQRLREDDKITPMMLPIVEDMSSNGDKSNLLYCGAVKSHELERLVIQEPVDILRHVVDNDILESPLHISPETSLKTAYLQAQAHGLEGPLMVVEKGRFEGILPHADLLDLSELGSHS